MTLVFVNGPPLAFCDPACRDAVPRDTLGLRSHPCQCDLAHHHVALGQLDHELLGSPAARPASGERKGRGWTVSPTSSLRGSISFSSRRETRYPPRGRTPNAPWPATGSWSCSTSPSRW